MTGSGLGQGHSGRLWSEEGGRGGLHALPVSVDRRPAWRNLTQGSDSVDFLVVDDGRVAVVVVAAAAEGCAVAVDDEAVAVVAQFMFDGRG